MVWPQQLHGLGAAADPVVRPRATTQPWSGGGDARLPSGGVASHRRCGPERRIQLMAAAPRFVAARQWQIWLGGWEWARQ